MTTKDNMHKPAAGRLELGPRAPILHANAHATARGLGGSSASEFPTPLPASW